MSDPVREALALAIARLEDMLKGDDGQAWKEAERALPGLRAALAQPAEPVAGWRMVPVEPTTDMRNAFHAVTDDEALQLGESGSRWAAMVAAAPPAPQPAGRALTADDLWNNHEIMSINGAEAGLSMDTLLKLVRAIERAHGIKSEGE